MSSSSPVQDTLAAVVDHAIAYEDYAELLRTLLPNVRKICFYDASSRIQWMSDGIEAPKLTFQITKALLQANASVCNSQTVESKTEVTHVAAVRGPDDSVRGAIAVVMGRRRYGRKSTKIRPERIETALAPLLRILGRSLNPAIPSDTAIALRPTAAQESPRRIARPSHDPFVGAAARAMSAPVILRRTVSNAVDAVSCAFGAFIAADRHHTIVQRGNEQKQVLTELRHLVDTLRHPLAKLMHTRDEPTLFASADLAPIGVADHKLIAWPVRKAGGQLAALLALVRRRHERDFDAADYASLRDVAMRIPAHVIDERAPFSHEPAPASAPAEIVKAHLEGTPVVVSIADPVRSTPSLEKQLRTALRKDGFDLHAQSIAPLRDASQTTRYEVLVRLRQGDALQLPQAFLETAEHCRLLPDIDRWVVGQLLNVVRPHVDALRAGRWEFALNVSAASLQRESFGDFIEAQLFRSGVPPQALVFEFSEFDVLANRSTFEPLARRLVELGCRVALDNCRQGLDIFLSIGRLPVHRLKIDAALTHHITTDARAAHAVRELVEVARDVDVETVGEQIEDEATCQMLRELGVDFAQGFTIARPRPLSELFQ